jgi:flagellar protein FlgJ
METGASRPVERQALAEPVDHGAFVRRVAPYARAAGEALGVDPKLIVAQAALESGWGGAAIDRADGRPAFNFFGVKAGSGWTGDTVSRRTVEFTDGIAQRRWERFRAYPDLESGFRDYVELIRDSGRYGAAFGDRLGADAYVNALAEGGYATDPDYGEKWLAIYRGERLDRAYAGSL